MPDKPDITFTSAKNASKSGITFVMSSVPDDDWKKCFNTHWAQSSLLVNSGLQHTLQGVNLSIQGTIGNPQGILDELKRIAVECNKAEDDFQAKVDNLKF
jgi:hypothetical protein